MPRKLIKRWFPDLHLVRRHKSLHLFGDLLHSPNLWHLNRRSVAGGFAVGLFSAFVPIPFQMILAAAIAIVSRVNLPISVVLVWVSNPITMPPMFYSAFKLGQWVLDEAPGEFNFELSLDWLRTELTDIWQPFLLGCLLMGTASAVMGYAGIRLYWRYLVVQRLEKRRRRLPSPRIGRKDMLRSEKSKPVNDSRLGHIGSGDEPDNTMK